MGKSLNILSSLWIFFDNQYFLSPADDEEFEAEVRLFAQAAKVELN